MRHRCRFVQVFPRGSTVRQKGRWSFRKTEVITFHILLLYKTIVSMSVLIYIPIHPLIRYGTSTTHARHHSRFSGMCLNFSQDFRKTLHSLHALRQVFWGDTLVDYLGTVDYEPCGTNGEAVDVAEIRKSLTIIVTVTKTMQDVVRTTKASNC